jgi:hypothetical protein
MPQKKSEKKQHFRYFLRKFTYTRMSSVTAPALAIKCRVTSSGICVKNSRGTSENRQIISQYQKAEKKQKTKKKPAPKR